MAWIINSSASQIMFHRWPSCLLDMVDVSSCSCLTFWWRSLEHVLHFLLPSLCSAFSGLVVAWLYLAYHSTPCPSVWFLVPLFYLTKGMLMTWGPNLMKMCFICFKFLSGSPLVWELWWARWVATVTHWASWSWHWWPTTSGTGGG